ncbi:hypothetical protein, variant [Spizellomyces punctatus DAOM BR117]|uniref:RRM domain-containing protein n=1 Tax=Spizellomyces punctatus (strain DAOM BR117) TaxID=645134 RepID=A0A0L0HPV6_SPIPD|nr:hypothetical protein, variant [Spizellomyces punctatus DAOM BR117]KND02844.1 hypothetical protein, variant [Spizellomyces punctatus DAOM BR117]|eukprot:XP_016610883.1 hypothetical protein, variant [Spizellomyces punctatus DAOM BR117]
MHHSAVSRSKSATPTPRTRSCSPMLTIVNDLRTLPSSVRRHNSFHKSPDDTIRTRRQMPSVTMNRSHSATTTRTATPEQAENVYPHFDSSPQEGWRMERQSPITVDLEHTSVLDDVKDECPISSSPCEQHLSAASAQQDVPNNRITEASGDDGGILPLSRLDADVRTAELRVRYPNKGLPQACLFVASLSSSRTDEQLHESVTNHFERWGKLMNVKVLKDWLARPYAFVQFESVEDSKHALVEAHNTVIDGRHIRVEQARVNRTLFIAKFNKSVAEYVQDANDVKAVTSQLRQILERYGPVEDLTILQNYQTGRSKGCGFVKFCFREDAIRAYLGLRTNLKWVAEWSDNYCVLPPSQFSGYSFSHDQLCSPSGSDIRPQHSLHHHLHRAANLDRGNVDIDRLSIFVGQLNQAVITRELLEEKFGQYGPIQSLQLINRYPTGPNSRPAFAFIKFLDEATPEHAIQEENGKLWLDRTIRVQFRETGEFRVQRPPAVPYSPSVIPYAALSSSLRGPGGFAGPVGFASTATFARTPPSTGVTRSATFLSPRRHAFPAALQLGGNRGRIGFVTENSPGHLAGDQASRFIPPDTLMYANPVPFLSNPYAVYPSPPVYDASTHLPQPPPLGTLTPPGDATLPMASAGLYLGPHHIVQVGTPYVSARGASFRPQGQITWSNERETWKTHLTPPPQSAVGLSVLQNAGCANTVDPTMVSGPCLTGSITEDQGWEETNPLWAADV